MHLRNRRLKTDDGGCWVEILEAYEADFLVDRHAPLDDVSSHVGAQFVEISSGSLVVVRLVRHNDVPSFFTRCVWVTGFWVPGGMSPRRFSPWRGRTTEITQETRQEEVRSQ